MPATVLEDLGEELRQAREARGLSLEDAEKATRIRVRYIAALEEGDLDVIPTPVQVRGFLRNYSQFVGLDQEQALSRLDASLNGPRKGLWRSFFGRNRPVPDPTPIPTVSRTSHPSTKGQVSTSRRLRRFLTIDVLIVLVVLISVIAFFVWGGSKIAAVNFAQREITVTPELLGPTVTQTLLSRISFTPTNPPPLVSFSDVQLSLVVEQRSFVRVIVDGAVGFEGTMMPGERRDYVGAKLVEVTTGNGAGIRVIFKQRDEGLMGSFGEVVTWVFTPSDKTTPVPTKAAAATETPAPDG